MWSYFISTISLSLSLLNDDEWLMKMHFLSLFSISLLQQWQWQKYEAAQCQRPWFMILLQWCKQWRVEEVQCGRFGEVCHQDFVHYAIRILSTMSSGGGWMEERQMQKHSFLGSLLPKHISMSQFCCLWTRPKMNLFPDFPHWYVNQGQHHMASSSTWLFLDMIYNETQTFASTSK